MQSPKATGIVWSLWLIDLQGF